MTKNQIIKMFLNRGYFVSVTYYPYGTSAIIRDKFGMPVAKLMAAGMDEEELLQRFLQETQGFGMMDKQGGLEYVDSKTEKERSNF
jgi:hypothetical protein